MKIFIIMIISIFAFAKEPLIVKNISGKVNPAFFEMKENIAKELGINLKVNLNGCIVTDDRVNKDKQQKIENQKAREYYNNKFGSDWEKKLDEETRKRMKN